MADIYYTQYIGKYMMMSEGLYTHWKLNLVCTTKEVD